MQLHPPFDRVAIEPGKYRGKHCHLEDAHQSSRLIHDRLFVNYPDPEEEDLPQTLAFAAVTVDGTVDLRLDPA